MTAQETAPTFFAGIFGITHVDIRAEAAAVCGKATSACNLWPMTIAKEVWEPIKNRCGYQFLIWDDQFEVDCSRYNCDLDRDGRADTVMTGHRGWLDFSAVLEAPFTDSCDQSGCGAAELTCRIENDSGAQVHLPACIAGKPGVVASSWEAAGERGRSASPVVRIPVYSGLCATGDCAGGTSYRVDDFACVRIIDNLRVRFNPLDPETTPPDNRAYKVILAEVSCDPSCNSSCGRTDGVPLNGGDVGSVSLIR